MSCGSTRLTPEQQRENFERFGVVYTYVAAHAGPSRAQRRQAARARRRRPDGQPYGGAR